MKHLWIALLIITGSCAAQTTTPPPLYIVGNTYWLGDARKTSAEVEAHLQQHQPVAAAYWRKGKKQRETALAVSLIGTAGLLWYSVSSNNTVERVALAGSAISYTTALVLWTSGTVQRKRARALYNGQ